VLAAGRMKRVVRLRAIVEPLTLFEEELICHMSIEVLGLGQRAHATYSVKI